MCPPDVPAMCPPDHNPAAPVGGQHPARVESLWGPDWRKPEFVYPYDREDGRENLNAGDRVLRVVRGGAFYDGAGGVRCACRSRNYPDNRLGNVGFRLVASPVS